MREDECDEDSIKVFLRVRPPDTTNAALPKNTKILEVDTVSNAVTLPAKPDPKIFTFDYVADVDCAQEAVFSTVGKSLIESCVSGYNATIFAYGQTGSGKTFTMLGPYGECDSFKHELRGVIPRSFEHLFNLINREQEMHGGRKQFLCKCSFLEIYQEQVYDLLDPAAANLQLRENIKKGVFVEGLMEQVVTTPNEAYQVLKRCHSFSELRHLLALKPAKKGGVKNVRQSQLNLVDLAGSERQKDTNTVGIRLKEAGKINKSLSILGNVIMSLVDIAHGRTRHVPYRDSKLTFLLRDSLGGNAKTSIVACVHPDAKCFGETLSTLNFAKRAKMIKNKAVINEDTQGNVALLQQEIRRLRDMVLQLQSGGISLNPSEPNSPEASAELSVVGPSQTVAGPDAAGWKQKFAEAMLFREKSEQEKEIIQTLLKTLEEEGKKKDKMLQSLRLIIRFRESKISMLEKNGRRPSEEMSADLCARLEEDLASLKTQLDQFPQTLHMHNELHNLRAQLSDARLRLASTTSGLLDSNRLAVLEQALHELQAVSKQESTMCSPSSGHGSSALKYRETIETLQQEKQKLTAAVQEERQAHEMREASMQAELTAAKKMVITTPKRGRHSSCSLTHVEKDEAGEADMTIDMEKEVDDICSEAPPATMIEGACEALTQEIKLLQEANNSLTERLNEYEADLLHMRQHVDQLELTNQSVTEILTKERVKNAEKCQKQEESLKELRCTLESLTSNLNYSQEETRDLKILLQSSDRQLKEERDKVKSSTSTCEQQVNILQTQVLQLQSTLETVSLQLDNESKEKAVLQETVESLRMEMAFLQEQNEALELTLQNEREAHKAMAHRLQEMEHRVTMEQAEQKQLKEQSQEFGKLQEEQVAKVHSLNDRLEQAIKERDALGAALRSELEKSQATIAELKRDISDSCEALHQQTLRSQELRRQMEALQEECSSQREKADSASKEVAASQSLCQQLQQQLQQTKDTISSKEVDLNKALFDMEMLREDFAYCTEQFQKTMQEAETLQQALETSQKEKDELKEQVCKLQDEVKEQNTQLCTMLEELEKSRRERLEENQALKDHTASLEAKIQELEAKTKQMTTVQLCQLPMEQMYIDTISNITKEKERLQEEQTRLKHLSESCQVRLEKVTDEHKLLQEEIKRLWPLEEDNRTLGEKVAHLENKVADLQEKNAILAGHANHQQKLSYVQQMQREYNQLKSMYDDALRKLQQAETRPFTLPMKDRTNLLNSPAARDSPDKVLHMP
ncbi:hypothetical protein C0Q70_18563 [Pomacea canaliculata]|uniref:Kinesin motor domain-containing protein n=1 Tax=Pomacea canaliculata TaxID=400727 RepID=A0A2T7NGV7_POMCA|nr:hypothetical protein C0Q70_18563 [Pomacea canaliculata]